MDRTEESGQSPCVGCGRAITAGLERAFGFGDDRVLCWDCAIERGGSWDAGEDRWSSSPNVEDLLERP